MKKRVCVAMKDIPGFYEHIKERLGAYDLRWMNAKTEQQRLADMDGADAILLNMLINELSPAERRMLSHVGMAQMLSAGAEHLDFATLPADAHIYSNVGGWAVSMAEHTLAMALCCTRKLIQQKFDMMNGIFSRVSYTLRSLKNLRLLIVGYGGIGRACAKVFRPLGVSIAAVGRHAPADTSLAASYSISELHQALPESDLILLALPATNLTKNMIGTTELELMKPNAILIDVARASLLDHDALVSHLKSHPDFTAALDVWWREDKHFQDNDPLVSLPNVVVSAHNSNRSQNSFIEALDCAIDNVLRYLEGQQPHGFVNRAEYVKTEEA